MSLLNQLWEELEEEGDDEQADVHAIDIGICCHDDLIISEGIETFFDIEGSLQQIELLVLVDHLLGKAKAVQWFTTQREHGLRIDITALSDASAGRIAFRNKDARLLLTIVLDIREVDATVTQLTIVQVRLFGTVASQFGNTSHRLALTFCLLDFIFDNLSNILMDMQIVVDLLFDEVAYIFINSITIR